MIIPPIPEETARVAGTTFGNGNIYLKIGEHIQDLLCDLPPAEMTIPGKSSKAPYYLYAMLTAFQFAEELSDWRVIESIRSRVDLKYALHLPLSYPSLDPQTLCAFRHQIHSDLASHHIFQSLLVRLAAYGLLKSTDTQPLKATTVLKAICTSTRMEQVVEAMYQVLEALAVADFEWLRQVTLPPWYERYSRRIKFSYWPNSKGQYKTVANHIGADMAYLLEKIDQSKKQAICDLQEVQSMRQIFEEQFETMRTGEPHMEVVQWRSECCAACSTKGRYCKEVQNSP